MSKQQKHDGNYLFRPMVISILVIFVGLYVISKSSFGRSSNKPVSPKPEIVGPPPPEFPLEKRVNDVRPVVKIMESNYQTIIGDRPATPNGFWLGSYSTTF